MKKIFFTTGPTQLYPQIKNYLNEAIDENILSLPHRSEQFTNIIKDTVSELKNLLNVPENFQIFFLSSGTECMERIIENLVEDLSFHFINGYFGDRFFNIAVNLNKSPEYIKCEYGKNFNFKKLFIPVGYELACFTQNETSTGVAIDMKDIYELKKKHPEIIFAIDAVSSVPYTELDYNFIDCAFFSVQKGFGMPSGLGIIIINKDCIEKTKYLQSKNINTGSYHNFINLSRNAEHYQTAMTPNMLAIYLCGKVAHYLNKIGTGKIRMETEQKAQLLYDFFEKNKFVYPAVKKHSDRSQTTLVMNVNKNPEVLLNKLNEKGFVLSNGYKDYKDSQIRIGNFPMHTIEDVKNLIKAFKSILKF
jgi:phosphoserine aminotransferase